MDKSFPRVNRLRGRSSFLGLLSRGARRRGRWCEIVSGTEIGSDTTRFGVSVTRRAGNAVKRNRIKRVVREYLRTHTEFWPVNKAALIRIKAPVTDEAGLLAELEDMLKYL